MYQVKYRCAYRDVWYEDLETDDWAKAVKRAREVVPTRRGYPVAIWLTRVDPVTQLGPDSMPLWIAERGTEMVLAPVGSSWALQALRPL